MDNDLRDGLAKLGRAVADVKSAINAKHSLIGIFFLLLIQYSCINADIQRSAESIRQQCVGATVEK